MSHRQYHLRQHLHILTHITSTTITKPQASTYHHLSTTVAATFLTSPLMFDLKPGDSAVTPPFGPSSFSLSDEPSWLLYDHGKRGEEREGRKGRKMKRRRMKESCGYHLLIRREKKRHGLYIEKETRRRGGRK